MKSSELLTSLTLLLVVKAEALPQVVYIINVENPTHAEEYRCISEHPDTSKYSWHRQNGNGLPGGVEAEGNTLHFMVSNPDLNGLYMCTVENQLGKAAASLFRHENKKTEL